jgi:hypothetical protein
VEKTVPLPRGELKPNVAQALRRAISAAVGVTSETSSRPERRP